MPSLGTKVLAFRVITAVVKRWVQRTRAVILMSWAMYQHVVRRTTLANVAEMIKEYYGLSVFYPDVRSFKVLLARYYEGTYQRLLEKLRSGSLIHADETEVHLKDGSKGYVWVFT